MKYIVIIFLVKFIFCYFSKYYFDVAQQAMNPVVYIQTGDITVGDYNLDGRQDIAFGGNSFGNLVLLLYRQNATLLFYDVTNSVTFPGGLPLGFEAGMLELIDLNADGLLDLFYAGCVDLQKQTGATIVYSQQPAGQVFLQNTLDYFPSGSPITIICAFDFVFVDNESNSSSSWNLIFAGVDIPFLFFVQDGGDIFYFVNATNPVPPGSMIAPNLLWCDYDHVGLSDFFLGGSGHAAALYRQNVSQCFFNVWNAVTFPGNSLLHFTYGSTEWVDFDGDGLVDLAFTCLLCVPFFFRQVMRGVFFNAIAGVFPQGIPPSMFSGSLV